MTDLNGKKIAIIATDRFEEAELVTPRDELAKAGAEVKIYAASTDPIQAVEGDTEPTQKVDVDGTFGDLDVSIGRRGRGPGRHGQRRPHPYRRGRPEHRA